MSNVVNLGSRWGRKFSDFMGKANLHRLFPRKEKVVVIQIRPLFVTQERDALFKDGFGSLIVKGQTLCDAFKRNGHCRLGRAAGSVKHEECACASLSGFGSKISDNGYGLDCAHVVEDQIDRERFEEVV